MTLSGANEQDVPVAAALRDAIVPIAMPRGGARFRPAALHGDRAYDARGFRMALAAREIAAEIPQRRRKEDPVVPPEQRGRLGPVRWVIERTFAWLNQWRRLAVRYERRRDMHQAFTLLGCALICWKALLRPDDLF